MNFDLNSLVMLLHFAGRNGLKRMLTIPESKVRDICKKSGADPINAIAQREQVAEQLVQMVEAVSLKGWVDPDHALVG